MVWVFLILLPLFIGDPVVVRVETASEEHCNRVRKVAERQLEDMRSNAGLGPCQNVPEISFAK